MLVGVGLAIAGVKGDVLRCTLERCTEAEELAVGTPASTFLRFFAEVTQIGNGLFPEDLGVLHRVDQGINEAVEPLLADDAEVAVEFFP